MALVTFAGEAFGRRAAGAVASAGLEQVEHVEAQRLLDLGIADSEIGFAPELFERVDLSSQQCRVTDRHARFQGLLDLADQGQIRLVIAGR